MNIEEIKNYEFNFTWDNDNRLYHAERALAYIANTKTLKDLGLQYGCSGSTLKNSYQKVARVIYRAVINTGLFTHEQVDDLYNNKFKCEKGVALFEKFYECMKNLPQQNFLDIYNKSKSAEEIYHIKLDKIINKIEAKRQKIIKELNSDFDMLIKWMKEIKKGDSSIDTTQ